MRRFSSKEPSPEPFPSEAPRVNGDLETQIKPLGASRSRLGVYLPLAIAMLTCATRKSEFRFSLDPDIDFHPALSLYPSLCLARLASYSSSLFSSFSLSLFSLSFFSLKFSLLLLRLLLPVLIFTGNMFLHVLPNLL